MKKCYKVTIYDGYKIESEVKLIARNVRETKLISHLQSEARFYTEHGFKDYAIWQFDGLMTTLYFADIANDLPTGLFTAYDLRIDVQEVEA